MALIDAVKKIEKSKNNQLAEGEKVNAGLLVTDAGSIASSAVTGGVGGILGFFVGKKMQDKAVSKHQADLPESEMTKSFPTGQVIIGLTDTRMLVYTMDPLSGKAKELKQELKHGDIKVESFEKGKMVSKIVLAFSDGGKKTFDVAKGVDVSAFQNAAG